MRRRMLLPASVAVLGAACAAVAVPAQGLPARTALVVRVDLGVGNWEQWTLTCDPTGGTHPNRKAACARLAHVARSAFTPVPADAVCTMIYGGPERATVRGTWRGQRLAAGFSRGNGCEIARWEALATLFTVPGTVVVRGNVELGPTCAVQQVGADCTDPSAPAQVTITNVATGRVFRTKAVAGKGFALRLPRGSFSATADAGMRCTPTTFRADTTMPVPLTIVCDTGIR